ncbi:unnamed protein product [Schistocephalus solidus]|uniref:FoP_duplication domain-containing protein n=2 Tax=Schistocephalus solidus TaxID=70667 RepID=A0A0X3PDQ6_SCHSO|nr:unnamed protein product [Schistocephalus solidus]
MDLSNKIDMSLDDIIKSNKKNKQAAASVARKASARGRAGRVSALKSPLQRKSALRPNLAVTMKSRQSATALAIFRKAQRTAAAAAKIAASAAALLSTRPTQSRPPSTAPDLRVTHINPGRIRRQMNSSANTARTLRNPTTRLPTRQRGGRLQNRPNNRQQSGVQRQFVGTSNGMTRQSAYRRQTQPQNLRFNNTLGGQSRRGINRNGGQHSDYYYKPSRRAQIAQSRRNQEYLAQARALIRAQEEIRKQSVYPNSSLPRAGNFRGRSRR